MTSLTEIEDAQQYPEYRCLGRTKLVFDWIPSGAKQLLDVGCAYGYGTRFYARKSARTVAIDPAPSLIEVAQRRYPQIAFAASNLEDMNFEADSFDVVVMADVFEHVPDETQALNEVYRILKPGGYFIVTVPNKGLFSFLDLDNLVFAFKTFVPALFTVLRKAKEGRRDEANPGYESWHRHYSRKELIARLEASNFRDDFAVLKTRRWGLLIEPLMAFTVHIARLFLGLERARRAQPLFESMQSVEDRVRCGALSYNLGLCVQKKR